MRIKITLKPKEREYAVPANYGYPLGAALYNVFSRGSEEFTDWLHSKGWIAPNGKPLKLFTFSKIFFKKFEPANGIIHSAGNCSFLFSSPVEDGIVDTFVKGIMQSNYIDIAACKAKARFTIKNIEIVEKPQFYSTTQFVLLSPAAASTVIIEKGRKRLYYLRPSDEELGDVLRKNLINKYELIHKKPYLGPVKISLSKDYLIKAKSERDLTTLVTIKEGTKQETKVKAFLCPLIITGREEIMQTAYDCGIGIKNSVGFGMIDVSRR